SPPIRATCGPRRPSACRRRLCRDPWNTVQSGRLTSRPTRRLPSMRSILTIWRPNSGCKHMTKTGLDHLNSLRDGRTVYLDGQRIPDVVAPPAYRQAVHSVAHLYDFQAAPEHLERLTFPSPTTGNRVNRCWQLPHSYADLVQRREALTA